MRVLFFISALFVFNYVFSQQNDSFTLVEGVVLDGKSKEEIPFATIRVFKEGSIAFVAHTEFDGLFQVIVDNAIDSLIIDCVGYMRERVLKENSDSIFLNVDTVTVVEKTTYSHIKKSCRNNESEPIEEIKWQETRVIKDPFDEVGTIICGTVTTIVEESEDLNLGAGGYFNEQDIKNMPW